MPSRRRGKGGGRGRNHRRNKPQGAMSTCNLPHDVIVNILSRLPILSLLRFRCVSKPWRTLLRNPRFVAAHLDRSTGNPSNTSLIVHSVDEVSCDHIVSLFRIGSIDERHEPINIEHQFPYFFLAMDFVGSCNGEVCLCKPPWGDVIRIWNPATKQSKGVYLSGTKPDSKINDKVSIGFGFDPISNDYKVSILCFKFGPFEEGDEDTTQGCFPVKK